MYEALGALGGAGAGGLLGQLGDVMSAPRRAVWRTLGAPEEGNELIAQLFGLDADSGLAKGLGLGAEMLLDPLNIVGAGLGALGGGGMRAMGRMSKMDDLMAGADDAAAMASKFDQAADAQRIADYTAESKRIGKINPFANQPLDYRSDLKAMLPSEADIEFIRRRAEMPGSGLTRGGKKAYESFSPEALDFAEKSGLGALKGDALTMTPLLSRSEKATKFVAPPAFDVRGHKLTLSPDAPRMRPYDTPLNRMEFTGPHQPRVPGGLQGWQPTDVEIGLRNQALAAGGERENLLRELMQINNPENFGLIEDMYFRGMDSPLAQALLAGSTAGGSMYAGSQFMGD